MWVLLADKDEAKVFETEEELLKYLKKRAPVTFHYFKSQRKWGDG